MQMPMNFWAFWTLSKASKLDLKRAGSVGWLDFHAANREYFGFSPGVSVCLLSVQNIASGF